MASIFIRTLFYNILNEYNRLMKDHIEDKEHYWRELIERQAQVDRNNNDEDEDDDEDDDEVDVDVDKTVKTANRKEYIWVIVIINWLLLIHVYTKFNYQCIVPHSRLLK